MYEVLGGSEGNVIGVRVSGKLKKEDYERLEPWLEKEVERHGKLRVLVLMEDFSGWDSLEAAWEDLKIDVRFNKYIERVALVGDAVWQKWMTKLSNPLAHAELRYFDMSHLEDAWAWIRE